MAFTAGKPNLLLIDAENKVSSLSTSGGVLAVSLAGARLFVSVEKVGIVEMELPSGKTLKTWPLRTASPTSLAALPTKKVIAFSMNQMMQLLDMDTGAVAPTQFFSHQVAADPQQEFLYSLVRSERGPSAGHLIINGRPVFIQQSRTDWIQSALFKYAVVNKQCLAAEIRMNAASNGHELVVSPDGKWVSVVGGGGWRPTQAQGHKAGYGIALYAADDFQHIQGFFNSGAYPKSAAVNPVTQQIVVVREKDAQVYHLSNESEAVTLNGPFIGPAAWSPDGKFLYLAHKSGVRVFRNEISAAEEKNAGEWVKVLAKKTSSPTLAPQTAEIQPLADYATFKVEDQSEAVEKAVVLALETGRRDKPQDWFQYAPYQTNAELSKLLRELYGQVDRETAGPRLYLLKKTKEEHKEHPGVDLLLGLTYFVMEQWDSATQSLLTAIQRDQARTNITLESLRCLGQLQKRQTKSLAAAYCYAHVMRLDLAQPQWKSEAEEVFKQAGLEKSFERLSKAATVNVGTVNPVKVELPPLAEPSAKTKLTAESLFKQCAASVVMIKTERGSGSGVCVAPDGIVITNHHVIQDRNPKISVHTYSTKDGKLVRSEELKADVLYLSETHDLALLRIKDAPKTLVPLHLETEPLVSGAKVFALGSPGLGELVLEQSITDGIVSSPARTLGRNSFVQHTASVNPGNSGGPLVNEFGHIVGIVTLKTELERVGFAIPSTQVRETYNKVRKGL